MVPVLVACLAVISNTAARTEKRHLSTCTKPLITVMLLYLSNIKFTSNNNFTPLRTLLFSVHRTQRWCWWNMKFNYSIIKCSARSCFRSRNCHSVVWFMRVKTIRDKPGDSKFKSFTYYWAEISLPIKGFDHKTDRVFLS